MTEQRLTAKERRAITQRTGARVRSIALGQAGVVTGHYDDDSVFVRMDGSERTERWFVEDLRLAAESASDSYARITRPDDSLGQG